MLFAVTTTDPIADVILAAGLGVTSYLGLRNSRQGTRTATKLEEVHGLVNAQLSDAVERRDVSEAENAQLRAGYPKDQP